MVGATRLVEVETARSRRLLADVQEVDGRASRNRPPVSDRLAAALGRDVSERIVATVSDEALDRLDAALTPAFAERLSAALAKELGTTA